MVINWIFIIEPFIDSLWNFIYRLDVCHQILDEFTEVSWKLILNFSIQFHNVSNNFTHWCFTWIFPSLSNLLNNFTDDISDSVSFLIIIVIIISSHFKWTEFFFKVVLDCRWNILEILSFSKYFIESRHDFFWKFEVLQFFPEERSDLLNCWWFLAYISLTESHVDLPYL